MVRNPVWSQSLEGFIRQLKAWVLRARCRGCDEHRHLLRRGGRGGPSGHPRPGKGGAVRTHARRGRTSGAVRIADRDLRDPEPGRSQHHHGIGRRRLRTRSTSRRPARFRSCMACARWRSTRASSQTPTAARIEALVRAGIPGAGVRTGADQRPARLHGVSAPIAAPCAAQRDHGDRGHACAWTRSPPWTGTSCGMPFGSSASSASSFAAATISGRSECGAGCAICSIARRWQTTPTDFCSSRGRRTRSWSWIARQPGSTRGATR